MSKMPWNTIKKQARFHHPGLEYSRRRGICSPKNIGCLERYGYPIEYSGSGFHRQLGHLGWGYAGLFLPVYRHCQRCQHGSRRTLDPRKRQGRTGFRKGQLRHTGGFANRAAFLAAIPPSPRPWSIKISSSSNVRGKIIKLDLDSQIISTGNEPDILIKPKSKLLTLTAEQLMEYGVADILLLPAKLPPITEEEQAQGKWPPDKSLLFTYPLFPKIRQRNHHRRIPARLEREIFWLIVKSHRFFAPFFRVGTRVLLGIEHTRLRSCRTLAVTCLFLIILSSYANEAANWLELIFIVTGMAIILVELFILPTFGLLGIIGIALFFVGLFGLMLPGWNRFTMIQYPNPKCRGTSSIRTLGLAMRRTGLGVCNHASVRPLCIPGSGAFRRFVLVGHEQEGYMAVDKNELKIPPGTQGVAITSLRPSGKIVIHDTMYDAISYGAFIEKNTPVVVDRMEGSSIVVNPLNSDKQKT